MARFSSWVLPLFLLVAQGCGGAQSPRSSDAYGANYSTPLSAKVPVTAEQTVASAPRDDAYEEDSEKSDDEPSRGATGGAAPPPRAESPGTKENNPQKPAEKSPETGPEPPRNDRGRDQQRSPILIYMASFQMSVFEVGPSLAEVDRLAREVGGFVTKRTDRQIVIRVPASRFYETVGRLETMGEVTQRDVVAQDVTEEYLDTEVRLRNARAMRDRLEQLLAKANTVQDSLMLERELGRVAAEIERMEGRLKYLRDRAAFSTITVSFDPRRVVTPPPSVRLPFPWLTSSGLARLLSL